MRRLFATVCTSLLIAAAASPAAAQPASFTYQGQLQDAGVPVSGAYEFQFRLYGTPAGNDLVAEIPLYSAEVAGGLFTAELDFGPEAFDGAERWLEIAVRPESDSPPPFTTLTPRQKLSPAPYALRALTAAGFQLPFAGTTNSYRTALAITSTGNGVPFAAVQEGFGNGSFVTTINPENEGAAFAVLHEGRGVGQYLELMQPMNPAPALWVRNQGTGATARLEGMNGAANEPTLVAMSGGTTPAAAFMGKVGVNTQDAQADVHLHRDYAESAVRFTGTHDVPTPGDVTDATEEFATAGQFANGQIAWTNPQYALTDNGQYATVTLMRGAVDLTRSHELSLENLGFSLPEHAEITGIQVYIEGFRTEDCPSCDRTNARLRVTMKDGSGTVGYTQSTALPLDASGVVPASGQTELWGTTWTAAQVNSPQFGVRIAATIDFEYCWLYGWQTLCAGCDCAGSVNFFVDRVWVKIHYTPNPMVATPVDWSLGVPANDDKFYVSHTPDFASPVLVLHDAGVCINSNEVAQDWFNDAFALYVNGPAAKPGGGSWSSYSDARLKTGIEPLRGTLDRLLALHGYEFEYLPEAVQQGKGLPGRQIGLLAQEVEQVFPAWVAEDADGYKHVTERATTALLVEALRDLRAEKDAQIAGLRAELTALRATLTGAAPDSNCR